jgi:hypothetical protein
MDPAFLHVTVRGAAKLASKWHLAEYNHRHSCLSLTDFVPVIVNERFFFALEIPLMLKVIKDTKEMSCSL